MPALEPRFSAAIDRMFMPAPVAGVPIGHLLPFDPIGWFGDEDPLQESMPSVRLLRTRDLVDLRFRFAGLGLERDGDGRALFRTADRGYLVAEFGPQHLYEEAFFEAGGPVDGFLSDDDAKKAAGVPEQHGVPGAGVRSRALLARTSRLVFSVGDERIPFTGAGLLAAMRALPLSVVPHASGQARRIDWREYAELFAALAIDDGVVVRRGRAEPPVPLRGRLGDRWDRTRLPREPAAARIDRAIAATRLARTADLVQARFGVASAVAAVSDAPGMLHADPAAIIGRPDRLPPSPRPPSATETALELPWRLQVSPHSGGAFAHAMDEVEHDDRVELWHTRLGNRVGTANAIDPAAPAPVDEGRPEGRSIRAVWTRDFDRDTDAKDEAASATVAGDPNDDVDAPAPFRGSLSPRDRRQLVHLTSDYRWPRSPDPRWEPRPFHVEHLMLTGLGGWLRGSLQIPGDVPIGLSIEEWTQRTIMARDQYVKVVYQGVLLPFGHRAALVKVTERMLRHGVARLVQRLFVVVKEPEREFRGHGVPKADRAMPFRWVRILTAGTPPLAKPSPLPGAFGGKVFVPSIPTSDGLNGDQPVAGDVPFTFRMVATDVEDRIVEFEGPLVFAEKTALEDLPDMGVPIPASLKRELTLAAANTASPTFDLRGQRIAYAPHADPDDTTLATATLRFRSVSDPAGAPHFALPVLAVARAVVPSMSAFTGQAEPVPLRYPATYLDNGPRQDGVPGNGADQFLEVATADGTGPAIRQMDFASQSDRSGGFVSPGVQVKALARRVGPVGGDLASKDAIPGAFDVQGMFPKDVAKLFGVLDLRDLLSNADAVVPRFVAQAVDVVGSLRAAVAQVQQLDPAAVLAAQAAPVPAQAVKLADAVGDLADAFLALATPQAVVPDVAAALADLSSSSREIVDRWETVLPSLGLARADAERLEAVLRRLADLDGKAADAAKAVLAVFSGGRLPESVDARLEWSTRLHAWPAGASVFVPGGDATLRLLAETSAPVLPGGSPTAIVSCSMPPFELRLVGDSAVVRLRVAVMEFSVRAGRKPDVNVALADPGGVEFVGPLAFVERLKGIIPFDGFSDPPYLDIQPSGITAGFDLAIPDLAVGVFALSNIRFSAALAVPFIGESLEFRFAFATREDPFRLQVSLFAGGGFLGLAVTPKGLRMVEAALEFGAAVKLSFVVASGEVSVMAGIYFRLEELPDGSQSVTLSGYFRARGEVDVLGLISASIEIYLELSYREVGGAAKAVGKASISIEVSICFCSFSVTATCERRFSGSGGDPTFAAMMAGYTDAEQLAHEPWSEYCAAFAVEQA
ncbi:hypothetical protein [Agromyces kandeliae]|uniref:Uncharacterized protein n=1 Tax=Agromyces kandeliae TaxID=2666141 RepID=A0A6L5QZ75_9MICO|nr:hypothetical protein [Agromyces kandeliae]MRX42137.1 hypothetical protein [Agromyces kandeliae]